MDIQKWKENHPKAVKVIKITAAVSLVIISGVGCYVWHDKGYRIELTTQEFRNARSINIGYSENLKNAALGIEAKGLDASKTWARHDAIIAPYM